MLVRRAFYCSRETLIKSLSDFTLEFLCIARNNLTRIASYLRKAMTKLCIKILVESGSAIESAFPSMLPVLSPVTDYRSPVFLDLVIQLDKPLFHGEVIRGGGLDSVKEDTAMGVGDSDEDMLTPDEAVRRQGAEIFR